ncbi:Uma2 family endonuclease [Lentibacillus cibarius]|uniref:Uma2 family endonuclease n=1 Tax=Lentibacillus cibarius TaxID=2583219 RepID=A0A549YEI8_9BACI|nr:Uma2 family endonuclease [Lentibacillus cibarius]TMN21403.1 Uma2 family endonuclease [Lentibacillus cibarius]TRM10282.1 Uma2 family endonuclease [Lentibacillus cibarius]
MRSISLLVRSCKNEFVTIPAPIDVILSDKEVRQPDLIMIHKDKLHLITNKGVEGSPDLVIEILSPTSIKRDRKDKMDHPIESNYIKCVSFSMNDIFSDIPELPNV